MSIFRLTATYGCGFRATESRNQFSLRIYTGGFASKLTALKRAEKEIQKYIDKSDYSEYEIINSTRKWFPSCFDYTIQFS